MAIANGSVTNQPQRAISADRRDEPTLNSLPTPDGAAAEKQSASTEVKPDSDNTPRPRENSNASDIAVKKMRLPDLVNTVLVIKKWLLSNDEEDEAEEGKEKIQSDIETGLLFQSSREESVTAPEGGEPKEKNGKTSFREKLKAWAQFRIDPTRSYYYYWTCVVALVCCYNLTMIMARASFYELQTRFADTWLRVDYTADLIYLIDMLFSAKKIFLENGTIVQSWKALLTHYANSWHFWLDLGSVLPTDLLYFALPGQPLVRLNRVLHCYRLLDFADRTETRSSFPNAFRITKLIATIFVIFHWNGCVYFMLSKSFGLGGPGINSWTFQYDKIQNPVLPTCDVFSRNAQCLFTNHSYIPKIEEEFWWDENYRNFTYILGFTNLTRQYMFSFYWSALILTTIGEQVSPKTNLQFVFVLIDILLGLLIFAVIVGNVGSMVSNMNASKSDFEEQLDGAKQYMEYRKVNPELQKRVIKWFSYIWNQKQLLDENSVTGNLPPKLKAEMAIHVHLDTLKRVRIFQGTEPGLLIELVLKLRLQVYSPGDYICRKGDVGKEMYIVKRGSLNVVAEDGIKVFVTLKEGSVFGELSILDIPGNKNGNKRTAGVRSVGYSDLFVLSKDDLWESLREYPEAKKLLLAKGREILLKDGLIEANAPQEDPRSGRSVEQRLEHIEQRLKSFEQNFDNLYSTFSRETARQKQRITQLEKTFKQNKKQIKRDCMLGKFKY